MPGDGAHFREPKTKPIPDSCRDTVLIETGRQTQRVAETTSEQHLFQTQIAARQLSCHAVKNPRQTRPLPTKTELTESLQGRTTELFSVHAFILCQHRSQPAPIETCSGHHPGR